MEKITRKKDGFVLAMAVVMLGVALTVASLLIALGAIQSSNNNLLLNKIETQIICEQVEYDFLNLSTDKFLEHLISLGATQSDEFSNEFTYKDRVRIKILNDFKKIEIYEIKGEFCVLSVRKE